MIVWILVGFISSFLWGIGRVMTDRISSIQSLHWIPTIIALAVTVICASMLSWSPWRRCRRAIWLIACLQAVVFLVQDYGIALTTPMTFAQSDSAIRVAHINVNWPGKNAKAAARGLADAFRGIYGEKGPDVLFISEYGGMLGTEIADMYCSPETVGVSIGRFAVVSRLPIIEVIPLFDDTKSTAAFVRFAAWRGNAAWGALLVDFPSDPAISRLKMLGELRSRLNALEAPAPDIIVGDFNTARGGAAIGTFAPSMRDAFAEAGVGLGATYPRAFPLWHIDQILLAPRVAARHYEVINTGVGKHRMQIATIHIADN